jgi:hypothetical protein
MACQESAVGVLVSLSHVDTVHVVCVLTQVCGAERDGGGGGLPWRRERPCVSRSYCDLLLSPCVAPRSSGGEDVLHQGLCGPVSGHAPQRGEDDQTSAQVGRRILLSCEKER